jgi:hypothetical protein
MLLQKCNDSNQKCGDALFSVDSGGLDIDDIRIRSRDAKIDDGQLDWAWSRGASPIRAYGLNFADYTKSKYLQSNASWLTSRDQRLVVARSNLHPKICAG